MRKSLSILAITNILLWLFCFFIYFDYGNKQVWISFIILLILISVFAIRNMHDTQNDLDELVENAYTLRYYNYSSDETIQELNHILRNFRNQTEQQKASIKGMSENLQALLSHLTMGMFLVDRKKNIVIHSKSLPNYFPDTKIDFKVLDDISRTDIKSLVKQTFLSTKTIKKELRGFHEGDLILEVTVVPILNDVQETEQVLVLLYDLTMIRNYEKLNMDFISNASHELRTPVTSIKGFAETIKSMPQDEEVLKKEFLDIIYNESLRLEHIVEHMLTLSKVKKTQLQKTDIDLNEFLQYIGNSLKHQLQQKHLHLKYDLEANVIIESDKYLLSQIILNLLSNAIRYTEDGGDIMVITRETKDNITICVKDTGIGISQLEIERIFERFYRVNKGRSRQSGGTGLGLSIVKELSQILSGKISVSSQLGQGSIFTLTLPSSIISEKKEA
ncbi:two-component system histidine kinase PnpS [Streptococcus parauberis]|uniref:histidine kinase n=1 Tax=Streptococcus parauberis NCFD 2020 TaxID=873447 RepID=F1YXI2_9STRE|nr:ATP-binding protein [Streptococcus parauberis]EGE53031.1 ATPase/histidine kinase/DNA gyrase B/HSP90 domain protein [Streptococcus parauberis NCFD 2020]PNY22717.1 Alkaline phosphatase synthesis sensor protein PhoR [Streptococcus parauberis]